MDQRFGIEDPGSRIRPAIRDRGFSPGIVMMSPVLQTTKPAPAICKTGTVPVFVPTSG